MRSRDRWGDDVTDLWSYIECFSTILFICEMIFCIPMLKPRGSRLRSAILAAAFLVVFNSRTINNVFGTGWRVTFTTMAIFAASVFFIYLIFSCTKRLALFCAAAGYATENLVFYVRRVDTYFSGFPLTGVELGAFKVVVSLLVAYLVYTQLVKRYPRGHEPNVSTPYMLGFVVLTLFVTNVLNTWIRVDGLQAPATSLLGIMCNLMLLIIEFDVFQRSSMEQEQQILEQLMVEREKQQRLSQENVELINVKCHDLKRQIAALREMGSSEERDRSIAELEQAVLIYDSAVRTGNRTLDTLLTEKSLTCEGRGIELTCLVDGECLEGIGAVDLFALFGNALDNAIEACAKLPNPDDRLISLRVERQGSLARIDVENTCEGTVELVDGLPVTTKDDVNYHGFGVRSIQMVVERHGGNMVITPGDGSFLLSILLPTA